MLTTTQAQPRMLAGDTIRKERDEHRTEARALRKLADVHRMYGHQEAAVLADKQAAVHEHDAALLTRVLGES